MPDFDPAEMGNEDPEWTVLLTMAALNVAEAEAREEIAS